MQPSNYHQTQTQRFKLTPSCGLAFSGLIFYFAHVLQQAHARDTALMNHTLPNDTKLADDLTDDSTSISVASVDQLEPVTIETNNSHAVMTTLVSDDDEDDQTIEASGKDAIDVPSQGASPLLLLGGATLIGGGIAVLANDDSSSNDNPPEDNNEAVTVIPYRIEGIATERHTLFLTPNEDGYILQDAAWLRSDNVLTEDVEQDTIIGNALTYALTSDDFAHEILAQVTYEDSLGNTYTAFTSSVNPRPEIFLKALSDGNPDLTPNHLTWYAMPSHGGDGSLGYHADSMDHAFMTLNSIVFEAEDGMTLSFMADIDTPDSNSDNGVGQDVFAVMYREEGYTSFTLLETNTVAFDFTSVDTANLLEYGVNQGYGGNDSGSREYNYDLSSLAGKNIQLQFVVGSDANMSNWWDASNNSEGLYGGLMLEGIKITNAESDVVHQSDLAYDSNSDSYTDSFMMMPLSTGLDAETGYQAAAAYDFGAQRWGAEGNLELLQISWSNLSSFPSDYVDYLAGISHFDAGHNPLENITLGVSMLDLLGALEYVSFENTGILWDHEVQNLYQAAIDEGQLIGFL